MYYTYALVSALDNRIYVGLTKNLDYRIKEHNSGKTKSTRFYRPWTLLYCEEFDNRLDARKREKVLKSGYGKESLKGILYKNVPVAQLDRASAF